MKGVYVLVIEVSEDFCANIGSLGKHKFEKANYAYIGSAQNNLEKRIKRHLSDKKNIFWHIDYLLDSKYAKITHVFYMQAPKSFECAIAQKLCNSSQGITGFGCSDCNCKAHLFKINDIECILAFGMHEFSI